MEVPLVFRETYPRSLCLLLVSACLSLLSHLKLWEGPNLQGVLGYKGSQWSTLGRVKIIIWVLLMLPLLLYFVLLMQFQIQGNIDSTKTWSQIVGDSWAKNFIYLDVPAANLHINKWEIYCWWWANCALGPFMLMAVLLTAIEGRCWGSVVLKRFPSCCLHSQGPTFRQGKRHQGQRTAEILQNRNSKMKLLHTSWKT